jgi:hypothetical protein
LRCLYLCAAVFLELLLANILVGQESINNASISGRIVDASGAAVEGAQVSAREAETNVASGIATGKEGRFRFPYLKVGSYVIKVHKEGFADQERKLTLTIGSAFELLISLSVAPTQTSITIAGDATVLEAARSQVAGTVSKTEIQELPLNGRNFLDAALTIPGVSPTNTAANQLFAET